MIIVGVGINMIDTADRANDLVGYNNFINKLSLG